MITWGAMVYTADEAAEELAKEDVSVEVVDLRSVLPWDREAVLESVRKTSKVLVLHEDTRTGGFGAEIAATIAEEAFESLDAPVKRIAAPDAPVPFSPPLEKAYIPQVRRRRSRASESSRRTDGSLRPSSTSSCPRWASPSPRGRSSSGSGTRARRSRPTSRCSRSRPTRSTPRFRARGRGVVAKILVQEGETVDVGTKLAEIAPDGAAPAPAEPSRAAARAREPEAAAEADAAASAEEATAPAERPRRRRRSRRAPASTDNGKTFVSPVVARIAAEHGVDVGAVPGTGQGGRVTKKDILAFIEKGAPHSRPRTGSTHRRTGTERAGTGPAARPAPQPRAAGGETLEPMSAMRKGIAEHMRRSLDTAAHVTSAIEVDMSKIVAIREKLKAEYQKSYGVNPTYLIFVARATTETLLEYPWINGEIRGDQIVTRNYVNLGFAVELADGKGLIVPVVKNAEGLNLLGMARAVDRHRRARAEQAAAAGRRPGRHVHDHEPGRLRHLPRNADHQPAAVRDPRHLRGRQAAVGHPGRHRARTSLAIRPIMNLTLTYDHRLVDGALAGRFLRDLREKLQTWGEDRY